MDLDEALATVGEMVAAVWDGAPVTTEQLREALKREDADGRWRSDMAEVSAPLAGVGLCAHGVAASRASRGLTVAIRGLGGPHGG